jgi:hypothetical protein
MKRRAFIAALGSAAAWPVLAGGQHQEHMRRIGVRCKRRPTFISTQGKIARSGWIDLTLRSGLKARLSHGH